MSCSLTLAVSAMAQQQDEEQQQQQKPKKERAEKSQAATEAKPEPTPQSGRKEQHAEAKAARQENAATQAESVPKMHAGMKGKGKERGNPNANANATVSPSADAKVNAGVSANANAEGKKQREKGRNGRHANEPATANKPAASPAPASASVPSAAPAPAAAQVNTSTQATTGNPQGGKVNAHAKKLDAQAIQTIKTQHVNFRAQPRPDKVPTVTFNQSYRISGADQWQGEQYSVFRSYHPENHDQGWYHSHYSRVEVIGGGAYYWNQGYWYPAWGYDSSAQYYAYDGPIYVGSRAEPPDRVIADVQATLQQSGYYTGEVDGLLGPLTRQALTAYQSDNGLYTTATIDEPTLSSLGMG